MKDDACMPLLLRGWHAVHIRREIILFKIAWWTLKALLHPHFSRSKLQKNRVYQILFISTIQYCTKFRKNAPNLGNLLGVRPLLALARHNCITALTYAYANTVSKNE